MVREECTNTAQPSRKMNNYHEQNIFFLNLHQEQLEADQEQRKRLSVSPALKQTFQSEAFKHSRLFHARRIVFQIMLLCERYW